MADPIARTVKVRTTVMGLDGKTYPAKADPVRRLQLIAVAHDLSHDGKSIRQIVAALAERGIRRSVGTVSADLNRWTGDRCSGERKSPPEHLRYEETNR